MSNIVRFDDFIDAEIRVTDDGRYSVLDVIKFCGQKNPRQVWTGDSRGNGLVARYPELSTKVDNTSFGGKGGAAKPTPAANRENILYIIGLLPGAIGRAYREEAAKVFLQFLDASPELATSIIDRATPEDLKKIETRLKSKQIRTSFASTLDEHGVTEGWQFGECTNAIYRPLLGGSAKEVRLERGLAKKDNLRDNLSLSELSEVMFTESLAERKIKQDNLQGFIPCKDASTNSAKAVRNLVDKTLNG